MIHDLYKRSIYRDHDYWDERSCKALLVNSIQRHNGNVEGSTLFNVYERDAVIQGFMIGFLDRTYGFLGCLTATDVLFHCREGAPPEAALALLRRFMKWAQGNRLVAEIRMAATTVAGEDPEKVAALYRRVGLQRCGVIHEWRRVAGD